MKRNIESSDSQHYYPLATVKNGLQSKVNNNKPLQAKITTMQNQYGNRTTAQLLGQLSTNIQSTAAEGVRGRSQKLPHFEKIQAAFGKYDISNIQAYTDQPAATASRAIGAEAYATGNKIAFADKNPDLFTAAHEAAHIIQQRAGVHLKSGIGTAGDRYEQHADAVAHAVIQEQSAESLLSTYAPLQNYLITPSNQFMPVQRIIKYKKGGEYVDFTLQNLGLGPNSQEEFKNDNSTEEIIERIIDPQHTYRFESEEEIYQTFRGGNINQISPLKNEKEILSSKKSISKKISNENIDTAHIPLPKDKNKWKSEWKNEWKDIWQEQERGFDASKANKYKTGAVLKYKNFAGFTQATDSDFTAHHIFPNSFITESTVGNDPRIVRFGPGKRLYDPGNLYTDLNRNPDTGKLTPRSKKVGEITLAGIENKENLEIITTEIAKVLGSEQDGNISDPALWHVSEETIESKIKNTTEIKRLLKNFKYEYDGILISASGYKLSDLTRANLPTSFDEIDNALKNQRVWIRGYSQSNPGAIIHAELENTLKNIMFEDWGNSINESDVEDFVTENYERIMQHTEYKKKINELYSSINNLANYTIDQSEIDPEFMTYKTIDDKEIPKIFMEDYEEINEELKNYLPVFPFDLIERRNLEPDVLDFQDLINEADEIEDLGMAYYESLLEEDALKNAIEEREKSENVLSKHARKMQQKGKKTIKLKELSQEEKDGIKIKLIQKKKEEYIKKELKGRIEKVNKKITEIKKISGQKNELEGLKQSDEKLSNAEFLKKNANSVYKRIEEKSTLTIAKKSLGQSKDKNSMRQNAQNYILALKISLKEIVMAELGQKEYEINMRLTENEIKGLKRALMDALNKAQNLKQTKTTEQDLQEIEEEIIALEEALKEL